MKVIPSEEEWLKILEQLLEDARFNKRKVRARNLQKEIAQIKLTIKLDINGQLKKSKGN